MTRKILCNECIVKLRDIMKQCPAEQLHDFVGLAKEDYICDDCGKEIDAGMECHASTIVAPNMAQPYKPWESQFIKIKFSELI